MINYQRARTIVGVLLLSWLYGCATPQTQFLLAMPSQNLASRVELLDVPFYAQELHQCGPASLAMALNAAAAQVTMEKLSEQVYLPGRQGSLQIEMLSATRRNGYVAYPLAPKLSDVLAEVAAGRPVVVLENLAFNWYPFWHYAVVVGYDLARQEIILRSGLEARQVLPLKTFEHLWARGGYWAMLVVPAGQLPATANEADYMTAVVALEKVSNLSRAEAAYRAGLQRWENNLTAWIGLGNVRYAQGDMQSAEQSFRQASLRHPESAIAYNNLAQTLLEQQRYAEALVAVAHAISLGGDAQAAAFATQAQIKSLLDKDGLAKECCAISTHD